MKQRTNEEGHALYVDDQRGSDAKNISRAQTLGSRDFYLPLNATQILTDQHPIEPTENIAIYLKFDVGMNK